MDGGVVKLAADLQGDFTQNLESPPLLGSEGLPSGSPEADTPDELLRAGFGAEFAAGFH